MKNPVKPGGYLGRRFPLDPEAPFFYDMNAEKREGRENEPLNVKKVNDDTELKNEGGNVDGLGYEESHGAADTVRRALFLYAH